MRGPARAARAAALHEAVGEEDPGAGVVELGDLALDHAPGTSKRLPDLSHQALVGGAVGAPVVIEDHVEVREVALVGGVHLLEECLGGAVLLLGTQHGGGAVGVVRAEEAHLVTPHALEAHPDVGLDVLDHVAEVDVPVGVGQGAGNQDLTRH